tara:strand:+ start:7569 stop:9680 length:2112 start_codon:yes stop_codon:yes gene_type:complete
MKNILLFFLITTSGVLAQNQKLLDSIINVVQTATLVDTKADGYLSMVDYYFEVDKDSANYYLDKALQFTTDNNLPDKHTLGLLKRAQFFIVAGKYDSSQYYYNRVWDKLEPAYNYDLYTKYYGDFGVLHFYKGDFKEALSNFEKALTLAEDEKNQADQLRFLNNKALAMSYLGQAEASIAVHERAIKLSEKLNDSAAMGKSFNNIGLIYEDMKEFEKALDYYKKALTIKEKVSSKVDIINSLYNVSAMYKEIGEKNSDTLLYAKAEKGYYDVLKLSEEANYGKVKLFATTGLAQLATVRGNFQKAITLYEEIIPKAEAANDEQTLRVCYLNVGVNYLKLQQIAKAENYLLKAKPLIEASEHPSDTAKLYKNLADLYTQKQQFREANEYLLKQFEIEKELSSEALQDKISDFEVKYETEKKENQILQQRAQLAEKDLEVRRKNTLIYGGFGLALLLGLLGYLFYNQQKLKNNQLKKEAELQSALSKIETQNKLQEQRLRISRDLHDNIGSQLTFVTSSIDNLKYALEGSNEKVTQKLGYISEFTTQTIYELRDTIWAMNKTKITSEDLQVRIANFIEKAGKATDGVSFAFNVGEGVSEKTFTSVQGMNMYRIIQEAVNNSLKYANAKHISVHLKKTSEIPEQEKAGSQTQQLKIQIEDDGVGFNEATIEAGNGLANIRKRTKDIKGVATIVSEEHKGTIITVVF